MKKVNLSCRIATTFAKSGEIDEDAFRQFLNRFIENKVTVYIGSAGSGEGHSLKRDELKRIYRISVEECKGKIQVCANPPEQHTAAMALEHSQLAAEAGVDVVNVYGPAGWHGYKPTDEELLTYYDEVLRPLKHPVALAPLPVIGYTPKPATLAEACRRHTNVVTVNLSGVSDSYFVEFKDRLPRDIPLNVSLSGCLNTLAAGASGLNGAEANIVPKTYRRHIDLYEAGKTEEMGLVFADLNRIFKFVNQWYPSTPRWIKMFFKVFKLPGGEGGLRHPYLMPSEAEIKRFTEGLLALHVPEIDEIAKSAGLI